MEGQKRSEFSTRYDHKIFSNSCNCSHTSTCKSRLLDINVAAIGQHHRDGGRLQIIKILITQGIRLESKNSNGWSALITAAFCGEVDIIILLLANGADVDAVAEDGLTALIIAAQV